MRQAKAITLHVATLRLDRLSQSKPGWKKFDSVSLDQLDKLQLISELLLPLRRQAPILLLTQEESTLPRARSVVDGCSENNHA
jgi:hypothetical protein